MESFTSSKESILKQALRGATGAQQTNCHIAMAYLEVNRFNCKYYPGPFQKTLILKLKSEHKTWDENPTGKKTGKKGRMEKRKN